MAAVRRVNKRRERGACSGVSPRMVKIPLAGPLVETRFIERPNRFLLRCTPPQQASSLPPGAAGPTPDPAAGPAGVEAHMADPGRLRELLLPGRRVWLRAAAPTATRRTRWTAVLVESPDGRGLVSVDTTLPNRLIHAALSAGALDEFSGWRLERHEVSIGASRIDFVLGQGARRLALEVKSVTLVENGIGLFPDAVTMRGARHVRELTRIVEEPGWEAAILFVLQRPDAYRIEAAAAIDPVFAAALAEAKAAGVRVLGRRCRVSLDHLSLGSPVPAG
jgi:sugar fermentation stimulation protein A